MTLGHGVEGIERVFSLLEREDVAIEEKEKGVLVLIQKLSSQETKVKLDLQGLVQVLTEVLRMHQDEHQLCALTFEALSEAVFVPSTVLSLSEEGTMQLLLDAFSWHQEEDFQANLARVFYMLSTSSQGLDYLIYFRGVQFNQPDEEELRMDFMGFDRVSEQDRGDLVVDPDADEDAGALFDGGEPGDATYQGTVKVLTDSLQRPLICAEAARLTCKTLMALAQHPLTLAIGCRCGTIPALLGVLEEAQRMENPKLAENAADALWQFSLDYKAKAQSSGWQSLHLLSTWLSLSTNQAFPENTELQRALLMALDTSGVHLQAKLQAAEHFSEVVEPICSFYIQLVDWEPQDHAGDQARADLLENCIQCLRTFAEEPLSKSKICTCLAGEPRMMQFLFERQGASLLGSFGSTHDLIPKGMEAILRPVAAPPS